MMQTAELRERNNLAGRGRLDVARLWTILVEREMRSGLVMVFEILEQDVAQVLFVKDDNVIQTFAAHRADEALDLRVLPRRPRRSDNFFYAHRPNSMTKDRTI